MMKKKAENQSSKIIKGFIKHHRVIYTLVLALVAVGIIGLYYINKDEFPTFQIKQGLVAGIYPGASAEEVKDQLTEPLENILFSFPEVNRKNTYSYSKEGVCFVYVDLNVPESKKDEVWSKIKLQLNASKIMMPPGVLAIAVMDDFSSVSSLLLALESDDKGYGELMDYAKDLNTRLNEIPEMAKVSIIGTQTEEIAV